MLQRMWNGVSVEHVECINHNELSLIIDSPRRLLF